MKILYGTTNPAKLQSMNAILKELDIQLIGLRNIDAHIEPIDESGNNPLENACIKAKAYYNTVNMPVFSCDTGLYIEGLDSEKQPAVHVRRVNGKELNDEEMIKYYTKLAKDSGGELKAKYKNAICFIISPNEIYEYDGDDIASEQFIITSCPHKNRNKGFPLDSISIDISTGKYYIDLKLDDNNKQMDNKSKAFKKFFIDALSMKL